MAGWVKLHRSLKSWGWYHKLEYRAIWVDLLLSASYEDNIVEGNVIKAGQVLTSIDRLSINNALSRSKIRTILKNLENSNEISKQGFSKYTIITILNWHEYQDLASNLANNSQSIDNQLAINSQHYKKLRSKEVKKERNNSIGPSLNHVNKFMDGYKKPSEFEEVAKSLLTFFNSETKKNLRDSSYNIGSIEKLLGDGYTEDQIKQVIVKKSEQWKGDKKTAQWLKPSTLFNPQKFDEYLNENFIDPLDEWGNEKNTESLN